MDVKFNKVVYLVFLLVFFFLFPKISPSNASIMINEVLPGASTPWTELLNTDQDNSQSLTGWTLQNGSGTTLANLSGTLPRGGFLTFTFSSGILNNGGDCVLVANSSDQTVHAISYGSGDCPGSGEPHTNSNPSANQSVAMINSSLTVDDTPTRGWCNDATGSCPTISTIISSMNASGVSTNLDSQSDYSRTSSLYFQKSETTDPNGTPMGKITFLAEINFTDRDALSWMENLGSKLDMNTRARISLDADLIKNLVSTRAQLSMYGLSLNNPKIQVDGVDDTAGIVSSITYSSGTLTFTAAHFTVFTAVENSSSSSSSGSSVPSCGDEKPDHAPHLFQVNTTRKTATLYFTPVNNAISYYMVSFGYAPGDERFGGTFSKGKYSGVLDFTVNYLQPNTTYYFKVRAGNGCMPGNWSNILAAKTEGTVMPVQTKTVLDKVTPTPKKALPAKSVPIKPTSSLVNQKAPNSLFDRLFEFIFKR